MTRSASPPLPAQNVSIAPVLPGLCLAALTLLFGFGLGIVFGLNEEWITAHLRATAMAAPPPVYHQDAAAMEAVLDKSWVYMQRAHLHAGSLGAVAVALSLILVLLRTGPIVARTISMALGAGALGYSFFWLWAGFRAPALGSTGLAKESLSWLAIPASGLVVAGTAAVSVLLVRALLTARAE